MVGDIFADFIVKTVLPHFAQSHLLTLTPPLSLTLILIPTPTPNPLGEMGLGENGRTPIKLEL